MSRLRFFHGTMNAGKSTLALQMEHNYLAGGRGVLLLGRGDRGGAGTITSRLGLTRPALDVDTDDQLDRIVRAHVAPGAVVIVDEAQFLTGAQVEQLSALADCGYDIDAFGILTDFASHLFPGSQRLLELADVCVTLQVEVLCWCGATGRQNARVVDGTVVHEGAQVLVGDISSSAVPAAVGYQVLCRRHWRGRELAPA